ncbi:MAG: HAD hydrolase family protein, partial [Myxococcota bacterium]
EEVKAVRNDVIIATGRSVCATQAAIGDIGLETPFVCYNGAVVYDPLTRDWLRHETIDDRLTDDLLALCESHALFYFVFHEDAKVTLPPRYDFQSDFYGRLENIRHVDRVEDLPRESVTKLSIFTPGNEPDEAVLRFLERGKAEHYVESFPMNTVPGFRDLDFYATDVHARAGGKGAGVRFVMERYTLRPEEVIAIGDHHNDLSMLQAAGLPVAMSDAPPDLIVCADRVIDHEAGNGVARFLTGIFNL